MGAYLVSYNAESIQVEEKLKEEIRKTGKWANIMPSTWIVVTHETIPEVRTRFNMATEGKCPLFLVDVTGQVWGTYDVTEEVTNWMKTNV